MFASMFIHHQVPCMLQRLESVWLLRVQDKSFVGYPSVEKHNSKQQESVSAVKFELEPEHQRLSEVEGGRWRPSQ